MVLAENKDHGIHHSIELNYKELKHQLALLELKYRISTSRKYWCAIDLGTDLSEFELLSIHNMPNQSRIERIDNEYFLWSGIELVYSFNLCPHRVYTPHLNKPSSDCLRC